jgi:hypothetical protein
MMMFRALLFSGRYYAKILKLYENFIVDSEWS